MTISSLLQDLMLAVLPGGGQRTARRNAWAAMTADLSRSRAWGEAEAAMAAGAARHQGGARTGT